LAILFDEPARRSFTDKIEADPTRLISAASYLGVAIIIDDRLDCFAYALARVASEPLLFKGSDFSKTDLAAA